MELQNYLRFEPLNNNEIYYDEILKIIESRLTKFSQTEIKKLEKDLTLIVHKVARKAMNRVISNLFEKKRISRLLRDKTKSTLYNWPEKELMEKVLTVFLIDRMLKLCK